MGAPYTSVTVSNYNANPPPDDGSQVAANRVAWATHKTKIGDPLKTAIESVNTNISAAFAKIIGGSGVTTTAISYGVATSDQGKLVKGTAAGITITTPDATTVTSPFVFGALNTSAGDITLDGSGSQTINGSASLVMASGDGYLLFTDGTNWFAIGRKTGVLGRGYIDGCTLSNGTDATNDINIAAGVCRDSTNVVDIAVAAMAGKQLDANWAPGAGAGMRNSAAGIADGTYHIYAPAKADGTQDIYAHTSTTIATVLAALQAESGGSAYIYARYLGSILRESGSIVAFTQYGNEFWRSVPLEAFSAALGVSTETTQTLLGIPTGIKVQAILNAVLIAASTGAGYSYFSSLDSADTAAGANCHTVNAPSNSAQGHSVQVRLWSNTTRQIRVRTNITGGSDVTRAHALGWVVQRGENA